MSQMRNSENNVFSRLLQVKDERAESGVQEGAYMRLGGL